ncbi:MAG TPA: SMI1/KNR4 family protein [Pseudonocardiaceae bacterium]
MWDAEQVRGRLTAMAAADPEHAAFGAEVHRYLLGPALSVSQVAAFEEPQGVTLPAAYREFVLAVGDGGAGPYYGLFRLDGSDMRPDDRAERMRPSFLATPFPHVEAWNPNASGPDSAEWMNDDEYFDPKWDAGSLIIVHFGCGAFFRLVVTGSARGQVWFDDRESDGGLMPAARDFFEWYQAWLAAPQ